MGVKIVMDKVPDSVLKSEKVIKNTDKVKTNSYAFNDLNISVELVTCKIINICWWNWLKSTKLQL